MKNRNEVYEISKKRGSWVATMDYNGSAYVVFRKNAVEVKQFGLALMTTEKDGTHTLYLPALNYNSHKKCLPAITDIKDYQYYQNGILLLILDGFCTFVNPIDYSSFLSEDLLESRRQNLPKIPCSSAYIRTDFSSASLLTANRFICNADGKDYLVVRETFDVHGTEAQLKIIPVGIVEEIPGFTGAFKSVTENDQCIYEKDDIQPDLYHEITDFKDEDYPSIFPKCEGFHGYWFKNSDGNILKMSIYESNKSSAVCCIDFNEPISKISFVNKYKFTKDKEMLVWKVAPANETEEKLIFGLSGSYIYVNKSEIS